MEHRSCKIPLTLVALLCCFCSDLITAAIHTITSSQFIRDDETITSSGNGTFKLGFFSPANTPNRYLGIWFSNASQTVVWVANRNNPLNGSPGIITISEDGNLVVLNGLKQVLWSSNVTASLTNTTALLLDSGNLVLRDHSSGRTLWQSFQEPTNTLLSKMKLSTHLSTGERVQLTSWKSPSDPSIGNFSFGIDYLNIPQFFIWKNNRPYWRAGPWNGVTFTGVPDKYTIYLHGFTFVVDDSLGIAFLTFTSTDFSYFVLTSEGQVGTDRVDENWQVSSTLFPETVCDVYGKCGEFGSCNSQINPICSCLRGFEPNNLDEWNRGIWTSGCVRNRSLQCERINKTGEMANQDWFFKLEKMKLPDFAEWSSPLKDNCSHQCLNNCSCVAYAYEAGIGCMTWSRNLIDIQKLSSGGTDLYIRLAHSVLVEKQDSLKDMKVTIITSVTVGLIIITICTVLSRWWMTKNKAMKKKSKVLQFDKGELKLEDLPLFNLEKLATATNNFNLSNKLGQGGFGPVFKGKLEDGQEIAVKRLAESSRQGLDEFMNEVMVIAKLQHRNLVRLLGCCVEGGEKMLVYEYMPNNSLDAFLFDPLKQELLDWRKRFNIIEGISRGLLYLHRDSRLQIIHRDLKASNILLDKELNPKISDFGTAKIFGDNQDQANTGRVMGTFGYMPPEYALEGQFSTKSDVFSFGVLLLEIVSGRKNRSFYYDEHSLSLLRYAWKLWNENNIVDLIDPVIYKPEFEMEIIRCIHVGLLCVQEFVKDRPSMSIVMSMLNSEILDLPTSKQPAYSAFGPESSEPSRKTCSVNIVTISDVQGR